MLNTKFQASEPSGSEEGFEYISMHFFGSNLRPPARGHHCPLDLRLNKFGKGLPGNDTY